MSGLAENTEDHYFTLHQSDVGYSSFSNEFADLESHNEAGNQSTFTSAFFASEPIHGYTATEQQEERIEETPTPLCKPSLDRLEAAPPEAPADEVSKWYSSVYEVGDRTREDAPQNNVFVCEVEDCPKVFKRKSDLT